MAIEICLRDVDADGVLVWEAAFAQAGRLLGEKLEQHMKGTDNE